MTQVFLLGSTGFIGGSVLAGLLQKHKDIHITALVRKPENVSAVEALSPSVKALVGDKSDLSLVTETAAKADIVISALDNNDATLARAVIEGLEKRAKEGNGRKPVLISTSGTGVLGEGNDGNFREGATVDDSKVEDLKAIPAERTHRAVDLEVFHAHARGHILTYIIAPAAIYGPGKGPVRKTSMGLHLLVQLTLKHSGSPVVNEGTAVWADVHIDDVVDLYIRVLDKALKDAFASATTPSGEQSGLGGDSAIPDAAFENFYFAVGHSMTWASWARTIAGALITKGKLDSSKTEPVSVTLEQEPYMWWAATNVRPVALRAQKDLGWKPSHPSFEETLPTELDALLAPMVF